MNLTIKGAVVGRGGDGGLPHLAFGAWETDPITTLPKPAVMDFKVHQVY